MENNEKLELPFSLKIRIWGNGDEGLRIVNLAMKWSKGVLDYGHFIGSLSSGGWLGLSRI
jgi:hypothetical protein